MPTPDSYDALAVSIERGLRADLAPHESVAELGGSIDRALLEEAWTGELRIAYVRVGVVLANAVVGLWALVTRGTDNILWHAAGDVLLGGLWGVASIGLLLALRSGWFRRWLRYAAPAADGLFILGGFLFVWGVTREPPRDASLAHVTVLCGFLAVSSALRMSMSSAQLSTGVAIGIFLFAGAAARLPPMYGLAIGATLLAMGVLSGSVTTLIRRVVMNQVGRLTLARMYEEARAAIDAREQVLKVVSHDLRNPLGTISMAASLMLEVPESDEQRAKHLTMIKRAGERMNRLVQDLLDVAKFEAGRLAIAPRPIDVQSLVTEASDMLGPLAAEKSIRLETIVASGLPSIVADPGRILQVLSNLVGNAIKFTSAGGRITIRADLVAGSVRFAVEDTGSGIPADQLPKIFGRFWQGDGADRRGIGLGLAIAKGIVEAHGGRIWVESRPGEGTVFYFTAAAGVDRAAAEKVQGALSEDDPPIPRPTHQ